MAPPRRPFTAERLHGVRSIKPGPGPRPDTVSEETAVILAAIQGLGDRMETLEARVDALTLTPPSAEPPPGDDEKDASHGDGNAGAGGPSVEERRQIEESRVLRLEITALAHSIEETKAEIAKLRDQRPEGDRLTVMAHELDAIVGATEAATNGILDIAEAVAARVSEIQAQEKDSYIRQLADEIQESLLGVFEHCNFQDLTGQRITKVVNTMKFIEDRVDRMMDIWGRDGFIAGQQDLEPEFLETQSEREKRLLNGPQTGPGGISQDEIDALFD